MQDEPYRKKGKNKTCGTSSVFKKYYWLCSVVFGNLNPWIGLDGRFIWIGPYRKRHPTEPTK
jgi:hypothetical protein